MEGYVNLFVNKDTSGSKPHFKGYIKIGTEDHEFALWPSQSGKGFSGKFKPKTEKPSKAAEVPAAPIDEIQF